MPRMGFVCAGAQRIDTGYNLVVPATGGLTLATWFRIPAAGSGVMLGNGKALVSFTRAQLNCQATNKVRAYCKDDLQAVVNTTSNKTVLDNLWHHAAGVFDPVNDRVQIIVDGHLDNTATGALGQLALDGFDFTPGCLHNEAGYTSYITGVLAEPAIYTRCLSVPEVRELMAGRPPLAGLKVFYPLRLESRVGASRVVNAATPGTYNGTLQGTPRVIPCPGIRTKWV